MRFTCPVTGLELEVAAGDVIEQAQPALLDNAHRRMAEILDRLHSGRIHQAAEHTWALAIMIDLADDHLTEWTAHAYTELPDNDPAGPT